EHRVLLTATLCLLAFGAVMVYSASSATSLLQGRGNGSGYLVKYLVYGAIGLVLMRVLARDGVTRVKAAVGPLLAVSFVLVLAVMYALVRPYARTRMTSFLNPWAHAAGSGFQAVQGQIAIGSGGLLGVGPGESVQKIFYLPEAPTDFILAVIAEELGVVGVGALLFLYGLIGYAGLR